MQSLASAPRPMRSKAPARFIGEVAIDRRRAPASGRPLGTLATFEPGARTVWHISPLGQTIIVKQGEGRMQIWGEPPVELIAGDVIWIEPGVKHWQGASPARGVTLFTIQEALDGQTAEWLEPVTNERYRARPVMVRS